MNEGNKKEDTTAADARAENFDVREDSIPGVLREVFGSGDDGAPKIRLRGLTTKDEIRHLCESHKDGWDILREVCDLIQRKGWNPTSGLIRKKLKHQLAIHNDADTHDDGKDEFERQVEANRRALDEVLPD